MTFVKELFLLTHVHLLCLQVLLSCCDCLRLRMGLHRLDTVDFLEVVLEACEIFGKLFGRNVQRVVYQLKVVPL